MTIMHVFLAIILILFASGVIAYRMLIKRGWTIRVIFTPKQLNKEKLDGLLKGKVHMSRNPKRKRLEDVKLPKEWGKVKGIDY